MLSSGPPANARPGFSRTVPVRKQMQAKVFMFWKKLRLVSIGGLFVQFFLLPVLCAGHRGLQRGAGVSYLIDFKEVRARVHTRRFCCFSTLISCLRARVGLATELPA